MSRISPNLRTYTSTSHHNPTKSSTYERSINLFSLPVELISLLLTYLSTPDLINFTNMSSYFRSLRTSYHQDRISSYLRQRREDQENLSNTPSPDRLTTGPLRDLNNSSTGESPSPKYSFMTPHPTRPSAGARNAMKRRSSCSLTSPLSSNVELELPNSMTPLSSTEKKSRRRLRRL